MWRPKILFVFMWSVGPLVPQAAEVLSCWGFEYTGLAFVWVKTTSERSNKFVFGMGGWTRANPEVCLLGVRGRPKRIDAGVPALLVAPRQQHSAKPDEVHRRIERLVSGPYLELFARRAQPGWDVWGNEVDGVGFAGF